MHDPAHAVGQFPATQRLRAAVRANAAFSGVSGLAMMIAAPFVAQSWGLGPAWLFAAIGAGVLGFAALVSRVSVQPRSALRRQAILVTAADVAWVAASGAVLAFGAPTQSGAVAVTVVAAIVALAALAQISGLVRSRTDDALADLEVVEATRTMAGAPEEIWPLLVDHDLYGRLAPNLSSVEVISDPGQPLRRRCTNTTGNGWEETCSLWEEGRRFAVEVDTSDYPYPLRVMRGLWQVDPHPRGALVTMRFAYQADPTVYGGLFGLVFGSVSPVVLRRIFTGWQNQLTGAPHSGTRKTP